MSVGRRIAVLYLAVNAVVLGILLWTVGAQSEAIESRFETDVLDRAALDLGRSFRVTTGSILRQVLADSNAGPIMAAIAIGELDFWDEGVVRQYIDRAVLVNLTPTDTIVYNPRRAFLWESAGTDAIDRSTARRLVSDSRDVQRFRDSRGRQVIYGRFDGDWTGGQWGFLFRLRPPEFADYDPLAPIRSALWVLFPGAIAHLVLLWLMLRRWVFAPIADMERAALRLSSGDYAHPLEYGHRQDEFGSVARAFNAMMRDLERYRSHMEGLVAAATERFKEAEKVLVVSERLAAMGRIAAGIAHEINNPLGGILNALDKLAKGDLPADRREKYAKIAEDGIGRIRGIVSRILATTPRHAEVGPVAIDEIVEQCRELVQHRLAKRGLEFVRSGSAGLRVIGDGNELVQAFLNLFLNACDAMEEGGRLRVGTVKSGNRVLITIADDGCGIPPEIRDRIFDLFFTTKAGNEGTGLGLGIVHNIVTGHGGTIEVESQPGRGSVFKVALPAAD